MHAASRTVDDDAAGRPPARERLIDAGLALFGTVGYEATTIQMLCQHARVSTRDFYRHVGDRLGLFRILFERELEQLQSPLMAAFDSVPPVWSVRARLWVEHWVQRMLEDPRRFRIMYTEAIGVSSDLDRRRHLVFQASVEIGITQMAICAEARGEHRPPRHYEVVAFALLGGAREVMARHMNDGLATADIAAIVDDMVRIGVALGERW